MNILAIDPSLTALGWASSLDADSGVLSPPKGVKGTARLDWFRNTLARPIDTDFSLAAVWSPTTPNTLAWWHNP